MSTKFVKILGGWRHWDIRLFGIILNKDAYVGTLGVNMFDFIQTNNNELTIRCVWMNGSE